MKLDGRQFKRLHDGLLDAYGSYSALKQMARFHLPHPLNEIAGGETQRDVVFSLLKWAEKHGELDTLLTGALAENSSSPLLNEAVREIRAAQTTDGGHIHGNPPMLSPTFTGREDTLQQLHTTLHSGNAALTPTPAALQGLGGIGKTQTALAYLYRHQNDYADLFWTVAETPEQLASALAGFHADLYPDAPIQADQNAALAQVKHWFATHDNWLLVVDNAENLSKLKPVLPPLQRGRLLLTTREKATGRLAQRIEVDRLDEMNGALLLLRRAGTLTLAQELDNAPAAWQEGAKAVSRELDGLPLALDQAGAYLETHEMTPTRYLELYRQDRALLNHHYDDADHASVAVTFDLAFKQVEQIPEYGHAAAQLVTYCAFLAPDAIPEEIFTAGAEVFDEPLQSLAGNESEFADVWAAACRYALLRHDADPPGFVMHRLAQEVVRERLSEDEQKRTAEQVMRVVRCTFPGPEFSVWARCERLLPHALLCREYIAAHEFRTPEASWLLNEMATYLQDRARYGEAEPLYREALAIDRETQGEEHEAVAIALNNLAALYRLMGRYDEATALLEQALAIDRKTIGEAHPDYATRLDNLALAYHDQRRYDEAEPLFRQALEITRQAHGPRHPDVAIRLNNLALVHSATRRYADAELLRLEALDIARQTIGEHDPGYATSLRNLGTLYLKWSRPDEGEPLLQQALTISETAHGSQHPDVAHCHYWLGWLRYLQSDRATSAAHFRQALAIYERMLGPSHPHAVNTRVWLADVEAELAALIPSPSPLVEDSAESKLADGEKGDG